MFTEGPGGEVVSGDVMKGCGLVVFIGLVCSYGFGGG
jgi:hypothetical protein